MKIQNHKGTIDLGEESTISIELTNPLLSEQGSASLPFSIKRNKHNDWLLDLPDRLDRTEQYQFRQPFNLQSGIISENTTFDMLSINKEVVDGVFYLYESSFYARAKEVKVPQCFEGIERWFQDKSVPLEERVQYIVDGLSGQITSEVNLKNEFTIFPLVVNGEFMLSSGMLNVPPFEQKGMINELIYIYQPTGSQFQLKARSPYTYKDSDGNTITVPVGYGVSPFLRFNYVLRQIFKHFDLTLLPNIFDSSLEYARMCVLNNTMDAIMQVVFIESQLVPDCTVNEFLDVVREGFCGDFIIDTGNKTARLVLFNDVMEAPADLDLTPYLTSSFEKIELSKPKQVKLTIDRSLPFAETSTSTIQEFQEKYPAFDTEETLYTPVEGIYKERMTNGIWKFYEPKKDWLWTSYKVDRLSSLNFDYDTKDDIEREEHKIPLKALAGATPVAGYGTLICPIIGSERNLNSFIMLDSTKQSEEVVECPTMIALEFYHDFSRIGVQSYRDKYMTEINPPEIISLLLWGGDGLFNRFWQKRDALLRTSFHDVTYKLRLPSYLLHQFAFDRLKLINGQAMIAVSLKYKMTEDSLVDVEISLKTTKIYS